MNDASLNRRKIPYFLFFLLLTLDVSVLIFEKMAAVHAVGSGTAFYLSLIQQVWLWLVLVFGPLQLWVWMIILERTELSLAFPVSSLAYPITMLVAQFFLGEHLSLKVWIGAILITLGVAIVGSGEQEKKIFSVPPL